MKMQAKDAETLEPKNPNIVADLERHYSEVRQRLGLSPARPIVPVSRVRGTLAHRMAIAMRNRHLWRVAKEQRRWWVRCIRPMLYRMIEQPEGAKKRRAIILGVCAKHGITLNVLLGPSRTRPVVKARREAISQVHQAFPKLGTSALGRLFRRDHATIQYTLGVLGFRPPKARSEGGRNARLALR
jgi:hypothetical protein